MAARELTAEAFDALLARLSPDRERAGAAYEQVRRRLIRLFDWRGCPDSDALADETMSRVATKLAEGLEIRAADPFAYCAGVAYLLFKEVAREAERRRQAIRAPIPAPASADARLGCLDRCLEALPAEMRTMVVAYYEGEGRARSEARAGLAAALRLDLNALRVRVHRAREQLAGCLGDCLEAGTE